jgi:hypothetical protein
LTGKLTGTERAEALKKLVKKNLTLGKFLKAVSGKFDYATVKNEILEFLVKAESKAAKTTLAPPAKGKAKPVKPVVEDDDDDDEDVPVAKAKTKAAKPEKVVKEKVAKEKVAKEKVVKEKFNRLDCVLITLKEEAPKTITEWIKKANALHVEKGGVDNEKQTRHLVVNYGASLKYLDIEVPTKK